MEKIISAVTGFHKEFLKDKGYTNDWKEYTEEQAVAYELPLKAFKVFEPIDGVYHRVELAGTIDRDRKERFITKYGITITERPEKEEVRSTKMRICEEVSVEDMIKESIAFIKNEAAKEQVETHDECGYIFSEDSHSTITSSCDDECVVVSGDESNAVSTGLSSDVIATGLASNAASSGDNATAITTELGSNAVVSVECSCAITIGPSSNAVSSGDSLGGVYAKGDCSNAVSTGSDSAALTDGYSSNAATTGGGGDAISNGKESNAVVTGDETSATANGDDSNAVVSGSGCFATATGERGNAVSTSHYGTATATGYQGNAVSSSHYGTAVASGDGGTAVSSGINGSVQADHKNACAVAWGPESRACGKLGSHLLLAEWKRKDGCHDLHEAGAWEFVNAKMVLVDGDTIKEDTWYGLRDGEVVLIDEDEWEYGDY